MRTVTNNDRVLEFQKTLTDKALAAGLFKEAALHAPGNATCLPSFEGEWEWSLHGGNVVELRKRLIEEEFQELIDALESADEGPADILKEATDLKYVIEGLLVSMGITPEAVQAAEARVHENNMQKISRGYFRTDNGKLVKPDDLPKVDLGDLT